jgi:uncharacterized RDD family membrane protein YckC
MIQTDNPYRSPASRVADQEQWDIVPAERWRRFVNFLIDYVGFFLLAFAIGMAVGLIGGKPGVVQMQRIPPFLLGVGIMLLYYLPQEMAFGRTLGKLITGTKVVDEHGEKPTPGQVLGRTFSRFIPFEAFSFFSADARGWHDSISHTYVVKCR